MTPVPTALPGADALPYTLSEVAPGVLVAVAQGGGRAGANATLVDLGGRVLAVDAGMTRAVGASLVAASLESLGQAPTLLVYTHGHSDHVWGAAGFGQDVEIIATTGTAQRMVAATGREGEWIRGHAPAELARVERLLAAEPSPDRRAHLEAGRAYYRMAMDEVEHLHVRQPTLTFDHRIVLHGSRRRAEILTYGGGHTASDAVVWLPDCGVLVAGDLVTVEAHPWLGGGDAIEWLRILATLDTLGAATLIPGHGNPSAGEATAAIADYIRCILETAEGRPLPGALDQCDGWDSQGRPASAHHAQSATSQENDVTRWAYNLTMPQEWAHWAFSGFYARNIISLASHLLDQPPS